MLRGRHQLPDKEVKRLYRILHIYSLGFHQVVGEVCLHAVQRQQLLLAVWKAFSQLWQDALQVSLSMLVEKAIPGLFGITAAASVPGSSLGFSVCTLFTCSHLPQVKLCRESCESAIRRLYACQYSCFVKHPCSLCPCSIWVGSVAGQQHDTCMLPIYLSCKTSLTIDFSGFG